MVFSLSARYAQGESGHAEQTSIKPWQPIARNRAPAERRPASAGRHDHGKGRPNADKFCPDSKILKRLGPAAREIGSGLIILQWDVSDGRVFAVSTGDLCAKPHQVVGGRF